MTELVQERFVISGILIVIGLLLIVVFYAILGLAFGIPYMIGIAKYKLSCMTTKRKQNHGYKEEE
jgi:hypothetical protein